MLYNLKYDDHYPECIAPLQFPIYYTHLFESNIATFFLLFFYSLSLSETTLIAGVITFSAWPVWRRTSWQKSQISSCSTWGAEASNRRQRPTPSHPNLHRHSSTHSKRRSERPHEQWVLHSLSGSRAVFRRESTGCLSVLSGCPLRSLHQVPCFFSRVELVSDCFQQSSGLFSQTRLHSVSLTCCCFVWRPPSKRLQSYHFLHGWMFLYLMRT